MMYRYEKISSMTNLLFYTAKRSQKCQFLNNQNSSSIVAAAAAAAG